MKHRFKTQLVSRGPKGAWTFMPVPIDVQQLFGTKGRLAVVGTINGQIFRGSLMPTGDGQHEMMFPKALQAATGAHAGDAIDVVLEADTEPRTVPIPDDLAQVLARQPQGAERFAALSYTVRKELVAWIEDAKRPQTHARRLEASLAWVAAGKSPKR